MTYPTVLRCRLADYQVVSIFYLVQSHSLTEIKLSTIPGFQISCSEKWWKLYFATKFYLCVSFLGFAIIAINLAKLPQEGNCSNRLLWRATLKGKKRENKSYSTLSMIWLATVMMSFPFFHNITNPSSLSTMHGSLKNMFDSKFTHWRVQLHHAHEVHDDDEMEDLMLSPSLTRTFCPSVTNLGFCNTACSTGMPSPLIWKSLRNFRILSKKENQHSVQIPPALSWSSGLVFLLIVVVAVLLISFWGGRSCNDKFTTNGSNISRLFEMNLVNEWKISWGVVKMWEHGERRVSAQTLVQAEQLWLMTRNFGFLLNSNFRPCFN